MKTSLVEIQMLIELDKRSAKGPWHPCSRDAESPDLHGPDKRLGQLAMFFWPLHENNQEAIRQAEDEIYSAVELTALARNTLPSILSDLEEAASFICARHMPDSRDEPSCDCKWCQFHHATVAAKGGW